MIGLPFCLRLLGKSEISRHVVVVVVTVVVVVVVAVVGVVVVFVVSDAS